MEFLTDLAHWWVDPFTSNPFMQRALLAGLLAVLTTSIVGTWVVLRGMAFLGDALAHGVLPGIAIAAVVGFDTTLGALVAALVMVGGVNVIRDYSPLPEDTSIGVLFVGFLALAVVVLSGSGASRQLDDYLFGSITGIDGNDLVRQVVVAVVAVAGVTVFYRSLLVMTFDPAQAELLGLRPRLANAALLVLLALSIVASFQTVGNLLVFAFLVAPPATASLLVRRVPLIMATAVGLGWAAVVVGLVVSFRYETATGATMALCSVIVFLAAIGYRAVSQALNGGTSSRIASRT